MRCSCGRGDAASDAFRCLDLKLKPFPLPDHASAIRNSRSTSRQTELNFLFLQTASAATATIIRTNDRSHRQRSSRPERYVLPLSNLLVVLRTDSRTLFSPCQVLADGYGW